VPAFIGAKQWRPTVADDLGALIERYRAAAHTLYLKTETAKEIVPGHRVNGVVMRGIDEKIGEVLYARDKLARALGHDALFEDLLEEF
jgi:uncharacterized membrane protein